MQGLQHHIDADYYAIISADDSMAGTYLWDTPILANKDFADLNNSPILKGYIDSLDRFNGERALYIKTNGTLGSSSDVSKTFTTYVIAGKKYIIVSEVEAVYRYVSFTSDFNGQDVVSQDVDGTSVVKRDYHIGTNIYTAPAGAKYMHITTQFQRDTNSLPYISIREYESDLADVQADLAGDSEEYYYTDDTIVDSYYNSFNAELGTIFNPQSPVSLTGWYCIKLNIHKGEYIQVCASTKLSTKQRPYVLTNLQNEVIRTAPVGGDFPMADTFAAESDGYLYVNNNSSRLPMTNFFVKVVTTGLTLDKLREISTQLQDDVSYLSSHIIPDDNNPLSIVKETAGLTSIIHKLGVIGASFTNGGHNKTSGTFPISIAREFSWSQRLAKLCGITVYNLGQPGMWSKQWLDDVGGYYTQMGQADYTCDAYIISFASNDIENADYPLGTIADVNIGNETENAASYYGYLSKIIARCKAVIPRSYLFMLTYPYNYANTDTNGYNQAMRDLVTAYRASGYNIYLIDYATYGMKISEASNKGMYRGAHFVGAGYQYMAYEICTYIDWIIKHNMNDFKDIAFVQTDAEYSN